MLSWSNRLVRDRRGVSAVEFAFFLPILLLLFIGMTEMGRAYYQSAAVQKGLRAGALFAARNPMPLSADAETAVENIVRTGNLDGAPPFLVPGWAEAGSNLDIAPLTFDVDGSTLQIVRLTASVPYLPLVTGFSFVWGLNNHIMTFSHDQAFIGD